MESLNLVPSRDVYVYNLVSKLDLSKFFNLLKMIYNIRGSLPQDKKLVEKCGLIINRTMKIVDQCPPNETLDIHTSYYPMTIFGFGLLKKARRYAEISILTKHIDDWFIDFPFSRSLKIDFPVSNLKKFQLSFKKKRNEKLKILTEQTKEILTDIKKDVNILNMDFTTFEVVLKEFQNIFENEILPIMKELKVSYEKWLEKKTSKTFLLTRNIKVLHRLYKQFSNINDKKIILPYRKKIFPWDKKLIKLQETANSIQNSIIVRKNSTPTINMIALMRNVDLLITNNATKYIPPEDLQILKELSHGGSFPDFFSEFWNRLDKL